ncbi:MAG: hypothetical protein PHW73_02315 [Atribacterota bacterium]|nr:hypothetical protein [Atribacterota bacterium]
MKIAQALLLRKQLEKKVAQLEPIKQMGDSGLFETKVSRVNVTDQVDSVTINTPRITLSEITSEFDKYASALRKLDASIQKANWEFDVEFTDKENPFNK